MFELEDRHYVTIWMEGEYHSGEAVVKAHYEISEVGWFKWDALPSDLFLPFANLLAGRCYPPDRGGLDSLRTV